MADTGRVLYLNLYLAIFGVVQVVKMVQVMATITPILRTSKVGKDGLAPVWVRVSDTFGTRYMATGVKVLPKDWNEEKKVVRRSRSDHKDLNSIISKKVHEAEEAVRHALLKGEAPTAEGVKRAVRRGKRQDFFAFAEMVITRMERQGKADSARRYRHVITKKLKEVVPGPLPFDRIDVRLLREWETHMIEKGNQAATVATAFRAFRSIYNKGVAEGLADPSKSPFLRFRPAPVPQKRKEKLTDGEMRAIEEVELKEGGKACVARDAFVFAFYAAGMRWKDICLLRLGDFRRDGDGWRLHYTSAKSHDTFALKLPAQAAKIAKRYGLGNSGADPDDLLFPFLRGEKIKTPEQLRRLKDSRGVAVNKQLKKVAKKAGVEKNVSFHLARHSFADLARVRGIDLYTISKALGHADLKTTQHYLRGFDQEALDGAMKNLFGVKDE